MHLVCWSELHKPIIVLPGAGPRKPWFIGYLGILDALLSRRDPLNADDIFSLIFSFLHQVISL